MVEDVDEVDFEDESLFEVLESLFSAVPEDLSVGFSEFSFVVEGGSVCLPAELPFLP